ncbi:uncharacterized protein FIBRA_03464 [Fibroporia radiculosa]|uniref:Uncharacterized protein n=1 Tax=Fibroporia radiculosa TaxID=599839 RepID=J4G5K4_9APHY|nr:uncharacterized protein FIBRA_03464 [Fibroporia radiculosa]CCM01413.1 predicted protein [Fibroporia radiculosa]
MLLGDESFWDDFPHMGFSIKPAWRMSKKGNLHDCTKSGLWRPRYDLVAIRSGQWFYVGQFARIAIEPLSVETFVALEEKVRDRVIGLSGSKRHLREIRSMYERGELMASKISFKRIGFNEDVRRYLLDSAPSHENSPSLTTGLFDVAGAQPREEVLSDDEDDDE